MGTHTLHPFPSCFRHKTSMGIGRFPQRFDKEKWAWVQRSHLLINSGNSYLFLAHFVTWKVRLITYLSLRL